jgi:NADH:ubiquinone oxidoreductase subunit K
MTLLAALFTLVVTAAWVLVGIGIACYRFRGKGTMGQAVQVFIAGGPGFEEK